jgi:hypothetical protein
MHAGIERVGFLYQSRAAAHIRRAFGERFLYANRHGNPAIVPAVLEEFRKLTEDSAVWSRGQRCWRKRNERHPEGRRQAD